MTLAGLLRKKAVAAPAPAPTPERDELEEYLSAPLETDTNLDLLAYWKLKESTWPKLAKMAKQYLASPFSSAGSWSASSLRRATVSYTHLTLPTKA